MLERIQEVNLYTNFTADGLKNADQYDLFMDLVDEGVKVFSYNYFDGTAPEVCPKGIHFLNREKGFLPDAFPFLIYVEVDDELPASKRRKVILCGEDEIRAADLPELFKLGR